MLSVSQTKHGLLKRYFLLFFVTVIGAVLDQYTKYLAVTYLKDAPPLVWIEDVFQLTYIENRGMAFGLLQNQLIFFICSTGLVFVFILWIYGKIPSETRFLPLRICCMFILAGAVGNFIDRVCLGYVVDFFYFELIDFPVFNVADIFVTASFAILLILVLFYYKDEELERIFKNNKSCVTK